jgi:hypothetical protein
MKTIIFVVIGLAILYLVIREYLAYSAKSAKKREELQQEADAQDIDRIIGGRPLHEVYEELDARDYEDLTSNELHTLFHITKYLEENSLPPDVNRNRPA